MTHASLLQKSKSMIAFALMTSLVGANMAAAAALTYSVNTTLTVNSLNITVQAGSVATQIVVGATTLTVTTGGSEEFTITSSDKYTFSASPSLTFTCSANESRMVVPSNTTNVVISPTSTVCTTPSLGGTPSSSGPAASPATPATPATPAVSTVTPAVPATPATPATPAAKVLPVFKGALEVKEVIVPTNGKVATKTNVVNDAKDASIELDKNVKLTGLKAGQTLQAPSATDAHMVDASKASVLKKKTVDAAFDLDADMVKANRTVKMQLVIGALETKGLKVYLLDEKTGKTKTVLGSMNKKTGVFTARTQYLGGYTLIFTHPAPTVKK
ncbi:MAG: hypothetical protein NTX63_00225 [Candidatus Peregrinibacteria bacterium]|nr:hypothetical protein [Candidatus Peregrinibacteria bacterium]